MNVIIVQLRSGRVVDPSMAAIPDVFQLQQQLQQQAADLAALQAQLAAQAAPQPQAAQAPIFALTPALAQTGIIDFSSGTGIKLRKTITAPLTTLYDGSSNLLAQFLDEVNRRATTCGWDANLLLISDQKQPPQNHHLITAHRCLTLDNVRAHATQYIGQQSRTAQDSFMMFEFLRDSLTSEARAHVTIEPNKYMIGPDNTADGPCFLKAILLKFHVETGATSYHLTTQLIALPKTIVTMHSNIATFNLKVTQITSQLAAGGEDSPNLLVYLFLAYLEAEDKDFVNFIKMLKMRHDSGIEQITSQQLMDQALTRYNQGVQDGSWKAPTAEQEQLIALTAQLKDANTKITALQKTKTDMTAGTSSGNSTSRSRNPRKFAAWKIVREGNETTKVHNGQTWYWCENHQAPMWVKHKPAECRQRTNTTAAPSPAPSTSSPTTSNPSTALQITQALTALANGSAGDNLGVNYE